MLLPPAAGTWLLLVPLPSQQLHPNISHMQLFTLCWLTQLEAVSSCCCGSTIVAQQWAGVECFRQSSASSLLCLFNGKVQLMLAGHCMFCVPLHSVQSNVCNISERRPHNLCVT